MLALIAMYSSGGEGVGGLGGRRSWATPHQLPGHPGRESRYGTFWLAVHKSLMSDPLHTVPRMGPTANRMGPTAMGPTTAHRAV